MRDIFVHSDHFIIYAAEDGMRDVTRLRYVLPDDYGAARELRKTLTPTVGDLAQVGNVVAGLPKGGQFASLRKRTFDLMARSMQAAFEKHEAAAITLV